MRREKENEEVVTLGTSVGTSHKKFILGHAPFDGWDIRRLREKLTFLFSKLTSFQMPILWNAIEIQG